jgi:biopolymer transport protein ExbB
MQPTDIQQLQNGITHFGTAWILWLLVALSFAGFAIIVERSVYFVTSRTDIKSLTRQLSTLADRKTMQQMRQQLVNTKSPASTVAAAGLLGSAPEEANELMQSATEQARLDMERFLAFLSTVGSNAPFVGLLGTVIGIVGAFRQLDRSQGALTEGLMSDIGEALVATAIGLVVALPAIAAFNTFRRLIQARMSEAEVVRHLVLAKLKTIGEE